MLRPPFTPRLAWGGIPAALLTGLAILAPPSGCAADPRPYEIAVYYWPNFHADSRNEAKLGQGWTEWNLVKQAVPRFPGHEQPKVPLWGYTDEADPRDMARAIGTMADHGITAIIFDWYCYQGRKVALEDALRQGFLRAENRERMKFSLMWANHDYVGIFPATPGKKPALWDAGVVDRATFDAATDYVIKEYFSQPNYWKIDGAPYFSLYEMQTLVRGLGGIAQTRDALAGFRARTKAAGFPDLHLNAIDWGLNRVKIQGADGAADAGLLHMINATGQPTSDTDQVVRLLGVSSVTSYTWAHAVRIEPQTAYPKWAEAGIDSWAKTQARTSVPYYPHVTLGWDSSPRTDPQKPHALAAYPYTGFVVGNTPDEFRTALRKAKDYLDAEPRAGRILTINSWNEWTEGSNLEPDQRHGLGYLEAIRSVFGAPPGTTGTR